MFNFSRHSPNIAIGALLMLAAVTATPAQQNAIVQLTIVERGGVLRLNEPVTAGIPLPKGLVRDASTLALVDGERRPVPAWIKPVSKWWDDGSLKWIHAHFSTSVPAGGTHRLQLVRGRSAAPAQTVSVTETAAHFVVTTGTLKFTVRKRNFNGIDEAWIDLSGRGRFAASGRAVSSHKLGPVLRIAGREYRTYNDPNAEVVVEERTPFYAVIKATGTFTGDDAAKGFSYVCRLTAFAGRSEVRAQFTAVNTVGPKRDDFIPLEQLSWELPVSLKPNRLLAGGDQQIHQAKLAPEESGWIYQASSDAYETGGVLSGSGRGKSTKPLTTGWMTLSGDRAAVSAGVRWFWQTYPKALEVKPGGVLQIHLYPRRAAPLDIYTGVSRTHDLLFLFHGSSVPSNDVRNTFAAFQRPLRAAAPSKWYARETRAFGNLVEAEPELFGDYAPSVKTYIEWWTANFDNIRKVRDGRQIKGVERDAYGWLEFGDGFHHVWQPGNGNPRNLAWDGNYYDFPHAALLHYVLTGQEDFFDFFVEHSRQLADVHIVHYDPERIYIGSNRYCPPTDHVRMDPTRPSDYTTAKVYVSNTFNHHKTQSLFENYLLTGDRRMLDVALMGLQYAHDYTAADSSYNQPRGPGNQLLTLLAGYDFTGDRKYLERCRRIVDFARQMQSRYSGAFNEVRSSRFQYGIALEGLLRYYEVTSDESVPPMVRQSLDFLIANNHTFTNCAYAAGFVYQQTKDPKYRDYGIKSVTRGGLAGNPVKETALTFRSSPYFLYYLATGAR